MLASVTSATAVGVVVAATAIVVVVTATTAAAAAIVVVAATCWRTGKLIKRKSEETRTESYMCLKLSE